MKQLLSLEKKEQNMNYKKHSPEIQVAAFCHANVAPLTVKRYFVLHSIR